jgi:hypothetical protein
MRLAAAPARVGAATASRRGARLAATRRDVLVGTGAVTGASLILPGGFCPPPPVAAMGTTAQRQPVECVWAPLLTPPLLTPHNGVAQAY